MSFVRALTKLACLFLVCALEGAAPAREPAPPTQTQDSLLPILSAVPSSAGPLSPVVRQAQHYLESAPTDRIPHGPRPTITVSLKHFELEKPAS